MRRRYVQSILICIVLAVGAPSLSAGLVATYEQVLSPMLEPLKNVGIYTNSTGFKVGTLTIEITGKHDLPEDVDDLELDRSFYGSEEYINLITNPPKRTVRGHLISRIRYDNRQKIVPIENDEDEPELLEEDEIEDYDIEKYGQYKKLYPIVIDFFVVVPHLVIDDHIGLQFAQGHSLGNFYVDFGMRIPFIDGSRNVPFTPYEFNEVSGSNRYINNPTPNFSQYVHLDIVDTAPLVPLDQAYFPAIYSHPVAKLQITLTGNYNPTHNSIYITFTSEHGKATEDFRLRHQNPAITSFIPFRLFLGNTTQPILYGAPNEWNGLTNGTMFTKNLYVGWVDKQRVDESIAGPYSEIIYVNITPVDTIP